MILHRFCSQREFAAYMRGVIVPKIVERNVGPYRDVNEICVSLFVAPDPMLEKYPDVVFWRRDIAGSRLGQF